MLHLSLALLLKARLHRQTELAGSVQFGNVKGPSTAMRRRCFFLHSKRQLSSRLVRSVEIRCKRITSGIWNLSSLLPPPRR